MTLQQILAEIRSYDGVLELAPQPGSEHPEISWGDGQETFTELVGYPPGDREPGGSTTTRSLVALREAHLADKRRVERR